MDRTRSPEREERLVLKLVGKTLAICYTHYCQGKREGVILKSNPNEDDKRDIGMIQDCLATDFKTSGLQKNAGLTTR